MTDAERDGNIPNPLPDVGTKVRALVDIHDEASNREIPQHAKAGDVGEIVGYHCGDHVPTVTWPSGGTYDSTWADIQPSPPEFIDAHGFVNRRNIPR